MKFYEANGFKVEKELKGYYTDLEESDCFVLVKDVSKPEEDKKDWLTILNYLTFQYELD